MKIHYRNAKLIAQWSLTPTPARLAQVQENNNTIPRVDRKEPTLPFPRCLELVGTFNEMSGGNIWQGLSNTKLSELERKSLRKYKKETGFFL